MNLNSSWEKILKDFIDSNEYKNFIKQINSDYEKFTIYPTKENIFRALNLTKYEDVKVVILGQDPYINEGEADGLAFSVSKNSKIPPSLRNIFKEIKSDLGIINKNTDLSKWAKQGVLLLNTSLTVRKGESASYSNSVWEKMTDLIIKEVSKKKNVIFLLWGNHAKKKLKFIEDGNYILSTSHPSPLSVYRGFEGCKHFSETNNILSNLKLDIIDWSTDEDNSK